MRPITLAVYATALTLTMSAIAGNGIDYPGTSKVKQKDDYHGTVVADPYRWLEDDVRESAPVASWVAAQNKLTFSYLDQLPQRDGIEQRLAQLWDFERYSVPEKHGEYFFYSHNNGLQNQDVIYRSTELGGDREEVLNPNDWSEDGTKALGGLQISRSGRYAAYGVQDGGSDWRNWYVRDLQQGKQLSDELRWIKFSNIAWAADESGFYYSRYPEPEAGQQFQSLNTNMAVYFHRLGTTQAEDRLVHARPDHPDWGFSAELDDSGRYLFITTWIGTDDRNRLEYMDLQQSDHKLVTLEDEFESAWHLIDVVAGKALFHTTAEAPLGRVVARSLGNSSKPIRWQELVSEQEQVLVGSSLVGEQLLLEYLQDAHSAVRVHDLKGALLRTVTLPGLGSVSGFPNAPDANESYYSYSSLNQPASIYRYDLASGKSTRVLSPELAFDPANFVVNQVFYKSADGTRVPMFIAHKKGLKLNADTPTLLYGYGGFNVSLTPGFSVTRLAWMDMGGIYALANLRGGGEYGEAWHQAGTKLNKQNVFDDFIAAAEYLIEQRYTRPDKLAIMGGSNGGLLVGAVLNQRPELFGAALPAVGVMDMLRFHKFTAGRFWVDDYGSSDNPEEFRALYRYSPYHNIKDGTSYPATLVTTADTDDRVVPGHSFKYIARLQAAQAGPDPILIRIQTRAGHGSGKPTAMIIREYADLWAFLAENLDMKLPATPDRAG